MNIAFFSLDSNLQKWVQSLGDRVHLVKEMKHLNGVVQDILDKDSYREMILFLDFDWEMKKVEAFNKAINKKEDGVIRIAISSEMSIKDLKKHQQGKTSCHGYLRKPLTYVILRKLLEDFGIYDQYKECFDFELPEKEEVKEKVAPKAVSKEEVIEDLSNELFGLGEETAMSSSSEINDIPELKDPEANQTGEDSFSLDEGLEDSEDDFTLSSDDSEIIEGDINDDIDEDFDLDLTDVGSDFSPSEIKVSTVVKDLVDLHSVSGPEAAYKGEVNDRIQAKFDHVFPREATSEIKAAAQPEHEHFMDPDDLNIAPITVHLDEELESELDELTQNRELPSPEELSEFEENTGDLDISAIDNDIDIDFSDEGPSFDDTEMELSDQSEDSSNEEELDLQDHEDISMNDENDSLDLDDELDLDGDSPEGELSFSDMDDDGDLDLGDDIPSDQGSSDDGLDFDLSMDLDEGVGELESSVEAQDLSSSDEGMDLGEVDLDSNEISEDDLDLGDPLEAAVESIENNEDVGVEDKVDEELDFSVTDSDADDELEFGAGLDDEEQSESSNPVTSSFDEGELTFGAEDDDEEIDATTVFDPRSLDGQATAVVETQREDAEEFEEDSDEELDFSTNLEDDEGDMAEDLFSTDATDDEESDNGTDFDSDDTNPTMLMSQDVTSDIEHMLDEEISTKEFRPETPSAPNMSDSDNDDLFNEFSDDESFDMDTANEEVSDETEGPEDMEDLFDHEEEAPLKEETAVEIGFGAEEDSTSMISNEILDAENGNDEVELGRNTSQTIGLTDTQDDGHLSITSENDRIPPSFHEGEAVRLQATIRQLREERTALLDEINLLKQDKKLIEQDSLGLRAELDEAKIEISILKKRHTSEVDEMKYKLRISDEKKLYAEEKAKNLQKEFDRLQHKVRMDFNQIKVREKELEGQLELAKMDSESQVTTRDKKILDLKRKIDQLEFNMENAVIKEEKSREDKQKLEDRLERIMKTLRGSIEVLEDDMDWQTGKKDGR